MVLLALRNFTRVIHVWPILSTISMVCAGFRFKMAMLLISRLQLIFNLKKVLDREKNVNDLYKK